MSRHRVEVAAIISVVMGSAMAETETNWLQQELKVLASKVGEPVSITLYLLPDDELQLNIETRSGRHGIAYGTSLSQMLVEAEEALFEIDEVLREIGAIL